MIGGVAAWVAAKSGTAAHGPVERIPGAREAVQEHEEWGERTRNVFVGVAALELVALVARQPALRGPFAPSRRSRASRASRCCTRRRSMAETSSTRTRAVSASARGNPEDVGRLLVAGLYNEAQVQRKAGQGRRCEPPHPDARRAESRPTSTTRLMWAESLLLDRKDPAAALAALDSITVRPDDARFRPRRDMLVADALRQAGHTDSARVVLQALATQFPANPRIKAKLDSLK